MRKSVRSCHFCFPYVHSWTICIFWAKQLVSTNKPFTQAFAPGREEQCFLQLLRSFIWAAGAATRMLGAGHLSRLCNFSYHLLVLRSILIISIINRAWLEDNPTFVLSFGLRAELWVVDTFRVWMQIKGLAMQIHRGAGLWIKNNAPLVGEGRRDGNRRRRNFWGPQML